LCCDVAMRHVAPIAIVLGMATGCGSSSTPSGGSQTFSFVFSSGSQGWIAGFADYPAGQEAFYELASSYQALPAPLGPGASAWFLAGHNHSDDLFMFLKRRVTGLRADAAYTATFTVELATDVPRGCGGVGGQPGESVHLKAGAATAEPRTQVDAAGYLRLSIDHGIQANDGREAVVIGTIENTVVCGNPQQWELKSLQSRTAALTVRTDRDGALWLLTGTDSGFEGKTSIYITRFVATLNAQ
jgi:hypothetical protein